MGQSVNWKRSRELRVGVQQAKQSREDAEEAMNRIRKIVGRVGEGQRGAGKEGTSGG